MSGAIHQRALGRRRGERRRPYVRRLPSALSRSLRDSWQFAADPEFIHSIAEQQIRTSLSRDGVATVEGVLEQDRCARVDRELQRQLQSSARPEFGSIHGKDTRLDLPLRMTGPIADALVALVARIGAILIAELGADARLVELSAIQALPGASAQPPHPDAGGSGDPDEARLLTVFVLLTDVGRDRGPLEVWPGSHVPPGKPDEVAELSRRSSRLMTGSAGTAVLMDARTWHRGTANTTATPRPVFYASWLSTGTRPEGPTWSLHDSIPKSLTLGMLSRQHRM
ncbi:MAG TPA: phytanoyl-CoA dioxygenase family protein [Enhygromyxa sp.]|nr:phytanoyl-CoA dioxygenase family protein [Enhygromyxa sp.]